MIKAIFWDFGGVITTSPFESFNRYEKEKQLPQDFIRTINSNNPHTNAWAKFERSDVDAATFDQLFLEETTAAGHPVRGYDILNLLAGDLRPEMINALRTCKEAFKQACLTNNVAIGDGPGMSQTNKKAEAFKSAWQLFDFVLESSKAGVRKPEPQFYTIACEALEVEPSEVVFLDDLGINLKPAKAMGMTTIKVTEAKKALLELSNVTGLSLV